MLAVEPKTCSFSSSIQTPHHISVLEAKAHSQPEELPSPLQGYNEYGFRSLSPQPCPLGSSPAHSTPSKSYVHKLFSLHKRYIVTYNLCIHVPYNKRCLFFDSKSPRTYLVYTSSKRKRTNFWFKHTQPFGESLEHLQSWYWTSRSGEETKDVQRWCYFRKRQNQG